MGFVAFYRVSSRSQETNTSLEDQRRRVRAWAQINEVNLDREIEAVESATKFTAERKIFQEAVQAAQECDGLIVYSIDRFFRNTEDGLRCARENFLETGKKLVFLNENLDISSEDGWVMLGMMLLMAEKEARTTRRRMLHGKEKKREDLDKLAYLNGATPYGYCSTGNKGSKILKTHPIEYPWRRKIFDWRAEGRSYKWIARELNRQGVRTKRGRVWRDTTVRILLVRPLALEALTEHADAEVS